MEDAEYVSIKASVAQSLAAHNTGPKSSGCEPKTWCEKPERPLGVFMVMNNILSAVVSRHACLLVTLALGSTFHACTLGTI